MEVRGNFLAVVERTASGKEKTFLSIKDVGYKLSSEGARAEDKDNEVITTSCSHQTSTVSQAEVLWKVQPFSVTTGGKLISRSLQLTIHRMRIIPT